jgi:hypothetical protein
MTRLSILAAAALVACSARLPAQSAEDFFERKVRPVLAEHCFSCHGPEKQRGGVRLDGREHLVKVRDEGTLVVPGEPDKSAVLRAVKHEGDYKMPPPPKAKLPAEVIADLTVWVKQGAVWPASKTAKSDDGAAWKKHWAFQPVRPPTPPDVKDRAWASTNPIDRFILYKLEAKGLTPSRPADPATLMRRLHFDLIGLPPTADEVDGFVRAVGQSAKPQAVVEKLVERLLASPRFGERWGRYWLDVARYADSKGYVFQEERRYPFAYTYRDYVVSAFNRDVPLDRFIVEQLAADRLVALKQAEPSVQAAMGYLTLGRRFLNNVHDIIDDRIDVVSRGMMGLTVQCARCHDHKYDPIPSRDYYSLYGVFASSQEPRELPVIGTPPRNKETIAFEKKLTELQTAVTKFEEANKKELEARNRKVRDELRALRKKVDAYLATAPGSPPRAMVLVDAERPMTPRVFLRGSPNNPGPAVPRQFLEVLAGDKREPFQDGSGRLELARAIASKDNPLTARVFVNRVWLHLLGSGLVDTPSDFGLRSEPPSHPELLDYLAWRFMEDGWSAKKLIRDIVLSKTYQQGSSRLRLSETANAPVAQPEDRPAKPQAAETVDPDNRLYWRSNRRRLDFEAMRDALLCVSGKLDLTMGGPAIDITRSSANRRTIYGFIDRQNLPGMFRTFDFASPDATSPQRFETTVPQQALFLLNSPFVQEQARGVVEKLDDTQDACAKIQQLHRLVYAREAQPEEVRLGETFVQAAGDGGMSAWERYAQVLLLSNEFQFVD